jgi:hypothetical protein
MGASPCSSAPAVAPGHAKFRDLFLYITHRARRNGWSQFPDHTKEPLPLGFAETAKAFVELGDRIADDLTLRHLELFGRGVHPAYGCIVQRVGDLLYQTNTILPIHPLAQKKKATRERVAFVFNREIRTRR